MTDYFRMFSVEFIYRAVRFSMAILWIGCCHTRYSHLAVHIHSILRWYPLYNSNGNSQLQLSTSMGAIRLFFAAFFIHTPFPISLSPFPLTLQMNCSKIKTTLEANKKMKKRKMDRQTKHHQSPTQSVYFLFCCKRSALNHQQKVGNGSSVNLYSFLSPAEKLVTVICSR